MSRLKGIKSFWCDRHAERDRVGNLKCSASPAGFKACSSLPSGSPSMASRPPSPSGGVLLSGSSAGPEGASASPRSRFWQASFPALPPTPLQAAGRVPLSPSRPSARGHLSPEGGEGSRAPFSFSHFPSTSSSSFVAKRGRGEREAGQGSRLVIVNTRAERQGG